MSNMTEAKQQSGLLRTQRRLQTASGNKIDKEYATERIDIVDAIIDAWMMAMKGEIKPDVNRYLDIWFAGTEKLRQKGGAQG